MYDIGCFQGKISAGKLACNLRLCQNCSEKFMKIIANLSELFFIH